MKSAVTISLVEEARGGPFVYWDDLPGSIEQARELGFDAVELFAPGPEAVDAEELKTRLDDAGLSLAAVGTGAGWVIHKLNLTDPHTSIRERAKDFIRWMIDFGGPLGAPAIIGSMQGRSGSEIDKPTAIGFLGSALIDLAEHADQYDVPLIYEPLNRYETDLCCTLGDGAALIESRGIQNVRILADLFHMQIEEIDLAAAIRAAGDHIGHVHFVDSNRRPAGCGHLDFEPVMAALHEIRYDGYLSAEALPWPDSDAAAKQTINAFRQLKS